MVSDGKRLVPGQAHIAGDNVNRFFPVPVGQRVGKLKGRNAVPDTVFILHIAGSGLVAVDLAEIMEKRGNCHRFLARAKGVQLPDTRAGKVIHKAIINIQAVIEQSPGIGAVKTGAGGGGKKIGLRRKKIIEEAIRSLPGNFCAKKLKKSFFVCYGINS